jgi:putative phosphoesterase
VRLAIISDIHGNLVALEAVLSALRRRKVNQIVCLGDIAATGPQPSEVIEFLQPLKWPCVMGNTDEALAMNVPEEPDEASEEDKRRSRELDEWTRKQLTKSHRDYLRTFKSTISISPKNGPRFLGYHGSPRSNRQEIESTISEDELAKALQNHDADIFGGGHTHCQMFRRFKRSIVMNPGSVGLPLREDPIWRARNSTRAEYAIANFTGRLFSLELLEVPYYRRDLEAAVRESGLPNSEWWLSNCL